MNKSTLKLNNGYEMPLVGLGTWKIPKEKCEEVVYNSLKVGYRLLDCACDYGNEQQVGQGIKKAIDEGLVTRNDFFVTSKLWNTFHRPEHVEAACRRTLADLGLEYLDLYLIHFPISLKYVDPQVRYPPEWIHDPTSPKPCMVEDFVPLIDTYRAMEELVKKGLVRSIGISNYSAPLIRDLLNSCTIKPTVLQIELHPHLSQQKLVKFTKKHGLQITAYSSFGASSYVELGGATEDESLLKNPTILEISKKISRSPAQVLLRWAVQQEIAVIPKTLKVERLAENADVLDWELGEEEMKKIEGLEKGRRYNDPGVYCEKYFGLFFPIFE